MLHGGSQLRRFLVSARRSSETLTVFGRLDEGPYHLGPTYTGQRHRFVTCVLAGQRELVELREPEFLAREVVVGSVVRITPQVTVVLLIPLGLRILRIGSPKPFRAKAKYQRSPGSVSTT